MIKYIFTLKKIDTSWKQRWLFKLDQIYSCSLVVENILLLGVNGFLKGETRF